MFSENDLSLWESIKKTLNPLKSNRAQEPVPFPKKLRVHPVPPRELMTTLDLHGLTVEEAYQKLKRFVNLHMRERTKIITVITGKGNKEKEGLIHHEIKNWLETPFFASKIKETRWLNGGGALEIRLKKNRS